MIFKQNYEKVIVDVLREIAADENINKNSVIKNEISIDSVGWLRFLVKLEKKFKCFFEPNFLSNGNYETVGDLVDAIKEYLGVK